MHSNIKMIGLRLSSILAVALLISLVACSSDYQAAHQNTHQNSHHINHHHHQAQGVCAQSPSVCQNGATCLSKPSGQYQCICVNGWTGQNCTENVDDCASMPCGEGGVCHDRVGSFWCECPPGKTGLVCHLEDECALKNPCHPNATCDTSMVDGKAVCSCGHGYRGEDCSIDIDECAAGSPCEHGGRCVNEPGTYRCACAQGFAGPRCEININECSDNPCVNGGSCLDEQGGYRCICPRGYTGQQCEINIDECATNPCENGATCKDEIGAFRCLCQPGYWGERCEYNASSPRPASTMVGASGPGGPGGPGGLEVAHISPGNPWSSCPEALLCWTRFSDGQCDPICNMPECLFDGKDCSSSNDDQFNSIINPLSSNFNNGNSINGNSASNNMNSNMNSNNQNGNNNNNSNNSPSSSSASSRFAGGVGGGPTRPKVCDDSYCLRNYANGICEQECNSAECGWDGLDCESPLVDSQSGQRAQPMGLLVIRVEPPVQLGTDIESKDELTKVLRSIYLLTKTVLKVQNYRDVDDGRGTEIELIADNRRCQSSCFNSTDLIAKFLTALRNKNKEFNNSISSSPMGWKNIYSKSYDPERSTEGQYAASTIWVIVCGSLATVCTVLMVISIGNKQRETKKAFNWFPEGFKPTMKTSRKGASTRDPTDRKGGGAMRGISTLSAVSGNFIRNFKTKERNISTNPAGSNGGVHSTDIDHHRAAAATPNGGGIYHEPYDYDQYGSTYIGSESIAPGQHDQASQHHHLHHQQPMTPSPMSMNPINIEGPHGMTPLMVASMGQPFSKEPLGLVAYGTTGEVVDASCESNNNVTDLLNRGAQLNLASKVTGETALHLAARCGRADNASRLLAHCDSKDVNAKDATGRTPLHAAIAADSLGVFELLIRNRGTDLNAQTHDGTTPLILAAKVGNYSMLEELILNECEVTKSDMNGKTALHWAAAVNNVDIIRRLLAVRETNKDAQDLAEETPLFLAAREGARGAVELLLSHNANKDIKDQLDVSPMDIARSKKHDDIVRLLEEYEPTSPRSITGPPHHSRQISPLSPDSTSNSNGSTQPPPPPYLSYTHLNGASAGGGGGGGTNLSEGGRKAQRAAAAALPDAYSVPCLKNFMTPSPDSPYSMESMVSPPVGYTSQQYQNFHQAVITSTKQAGVFI